MPSVFQKIATEEIDKGKLVALDDLRKRVVGSKKHSDNRINKMIRMCEVEKKFAHPLDMALLVYKTGTEQPSSAVFRILCAHVVERERRRHVYERGHQFDVFVSSEEGITPASAARIMCARFPVQELMLDRKSAVGARTTKLSYEVFLNLTRVHNVEFWRDPVVVGFRSQLATWRRKELLVKAVLAPALTMAFECSAHMQK